MIGRNECRVATRVPAWPVESSSPEGALPSTDHVPQTSGRRRSSRTVVDIGTDQEQSQHVSAIRRWGEDLSCETALSRVAGFCGKNG